MLTRYLKKFASLPLQQVVLRVAASTGNKGRALGGMTLEKAKGLIESMSPPVVADPENENIDDILDATAERAPIKNAKETIARIDRYSMTPHQYWLTFGKAMERPFTGDLWYNKDVGHYECLVCKSKLFLYIYACRWLKSIGPSTSSRIKLEWLLSGRTAIKLLILLVM